MNRRQFLFLKKGTDQTVHLSCEQLYMRYLDSTLDGTNELFFRNIEQDLASVTCLHLSERAWLNCAELQPMQPILAAFRDRGGVVTT